MAKQRIFDWKNKDVMDLDDSESTLSESGSTDLYESSHDTGDGNSEPLKLPRCGRHKNRRCGKCSSAPARPYYIQLPPPWLRGTLITTESFHTAIVVRVSTLDKFFQPTGGWYTIEKHHGCKVHDSSQYFELHGQVWRGFTIHFRKRMHIKIRDELFNLMALMNVKVGQAGWRAWEEAIVIVFIRQIFLWKLMDSVEYEG